jgi:hypothetical protein
MNITLRLFYYYLIIIYYLKMLFNLLFLCISLNSIQTQTIKRYNIPGDLVSISGDGNVMVIIDLTSGISLAILRKTGTAF